MELSDGISIAPFDKIREFIIPSLLKEVVWDIDRFTKTGPLGVVLKPFQWKPLILPLNANPEDNTRWDEGFSDNAEVIVDLLAIAHRTPRNDNDVPRSSCRPADMEHSGGTQSRRVHSPTCGIAHHDSCGQYASINGKILRGQKCVHSIKTRKQLPRKVQVHYFPDFPVRFREKAGSNSRTRYLT